MNKDTLNHEPVTPISREELKAKIQEGSIMLVDAQGPGWYEREHLPGAIKGNLSNLEDVVERLGDTATEIAVYCWSEACIGSALVSDDLARRGFSNVRRYVEGKKDWLEAGLPIETTERDYDNA